MAGNNYKLLIEGQLSTDKIEATIKSLQNKVKLNFQLDDNSLRELEKRLANITGAGGKVGKIKLFEDDAGRINKAIVEYTNSLGQVERRTEVINEKVKSTHTRYIDINKALSERTKIEEQLQKLTAKQADEMARASQSADKFLIKSQGMKSSPQLAEAVNLAQQIKVAASSGNIEQVRKLSQQFDLAKTAVAGVSSGVRSFTDGLKHAIKQTAEYALSIGLIYGALRQLKEGIQYVTDLNKEMTNIQVLQAEGAQTNEQIADLSLRYNDLAKSMGATTIEVAKGSVEWLRQGKSISETEELLKSTLMASKLGALDTAQATEYLTSIINGFNLSAGDAVTVVDKLIKNCQNI